jgi:hypothetical protein
MNEMQLILVAGLIAGLIILIYRLHVRINRMAMALTIMRDIVKSLTDRCDASSASHESLLMMVASDLGWRIRETESGYDIWTKARMSVAPAPANAAKVVLNSAGGTESLTLGG